MLYSRVQTNYSIHIKQTERKNSIGFPKLTTQGSDDKYLEVFAHKTVDEWVDEWVAHRQEVTEEVGEHVCHVLGFGAAHLWRVEPDHEVEDVNR